MGLNSAANRLHDSVRKRRSFRIRYTRRGFPGIIPFSIAGLIRWVGDGLSSGELELIEDRTIATRGRFEDYQFPRPADQP